MTVIETPEFLSACRKLMDEEDRGRIIDYLAANPMAGALIRDTGGVRNCAGASMAGGNEAAPESSTAITVQMSRCLP